MAAEKVIQRTGSWTKVAWPGRRWPPGSVRELLPLGHLPHLQQIAFLAMLDQPVGQTACLLHRLFPGFEERPVGARHVPLVALAPGGKRDKPPRPIRSGRHYQHAVPWKELYRLVHLSLL